MLVEYRSNNSGGDWWLTDNDWKNLEAAGWKVEWFKDNPGEGFFSKEKKTGRWLGALATTASFNCETPGDAMRSFEEVTGQQVSDEGCNCCGAPHSFSWGDYEYASGEGCLEYLYPNKKLKSLREFMEE